MRSEPAVVISLCYSCDKGVGGVFHTFVPWIMYVVKLVGYTIRGFPNLLSTNHLCIIKPERVC